MWRPPVDAIDRERPQFGVLSMFLCLFRVAWGRPELLRSRAMQPQAAFLDMVNQGVPIRHFGVGPGWADKQFEAAPSSSASPA